MVSGITLEFTPQLLTVADLRVRNTYAAESLVMALLRCLLEFSLRCRF